MDALTELCLDHVVIPSHTRSMKFAISVPDELFAAVDAQAQKMGISRSQFFAVAAKVYLEQVALSERVAEINAILDEAGYDGPDEAELAGFAAAFARAMADGGWEWEEDAHS